MSTTTVRSPSGGFPAVQAEVPKRGASHGPHGASVQGGVRLTRRGRLVLVITVLALALAILTVVGSPAASYGGSNHPGLSTVVVRPGQTLWDIAAGAEPGADPRVVVAEIMDLNDLTDPGTLRAGRLLYLPPRQ